MAGPPPALAPGSTIGILGGGQLGRMLALAAAELGLKCHIYAPEEDSCAFDVVRTKTCAAYEDQPALARFAESVDRITYEFENVPAGTATFLAQHKPVFPDPKVLANTQDRLAEKLFVTAVGAETAELAAVSTMVELLAAVRKVGTPAVLKTQHLGYDGKGQAPIRTPDESMAAWWALKERPSILERLIPFEREISVVAARGGDGAFVAYDVAENEHRRHILHRSQIPAEIAPKLAAEAVAITSRIANAFDYVGVLAVEMFVFEGRLLVNEIAPRVHNSGHWTLDGANVSQFEQHIRAVAGWPLVVPRRFARIEMVNLIGDEAFDWAKLAAEPGARLHLYGKRESRPGRKMGHVTRILSEP